MFELQNQYNIFMGRAVMLIRHRNQTVYYTNVVQFTYTFGIQTPEMISRISTLTTALIADLASYQYVNYSWNVGLSICQLACLSICLQS